MSGEGTISEAGKQRRANLKVSILSCFFHANFVNFSYNILCQIKIATRNCCTGKC